MISALTLSANKSPETGDLEQDHLKQNKTKIPAGVFGFT